MRLHPAGQVEIAVEQAEIARALPAQLKLVESMSVLVVAAVDYGMEAVQGARWPSACWVVGSGPASADITGTLTAVGTGNDILGQGNRRM